MWTLDYVVHSMHAYTRKRESIRVGGNNWGSNGSSIIKSGNCSSSKRYDWQQTTAVIVSSSSSSGSSSSGSGSGGVGFIVGVGFVVVGGGRKSMGRRTFIGERMKGRTMEVHQQIQR